MRSEKEETNVFRSSSIILHLARIYKWDIVFAMTMKLFSDIFAFANPVLLKRLIRFTENPETPLLHGVMLATIMFVVSECSSLLLNNHFYVMFRLGTRVQSLLSDLVYKKTMRLSNASRREKTVGEIVNLMAIDIDRFQQICPQIQQYWSTPFQIGLALFFLWQQIGVAVLSGVAIMVLLLPINFIITMQTRKYQVRQMYYRDERTKMVNEALNGIKVIKLYAWEVPVQRSIEALRDRELSLIRAAAVLRTFSDALNTASPFLVALSSFATYILVDSRNLLTPEIAFVSLTLFNQLRTPMSTIAELISQTVQVNVSNKRLKEFLDAEELVNYVHYLEKKKDNNDKYAHLMKYNEVWLDVKNFSASWDRCDGTPPTLRDLNINVTLGSLIAVVGKVGSGKSSLLCALLGEMERVAGEVALNPRVAFSPQRPWMQNETIRNNVLFGAKFDEYKYGRVMEACALNTDIGILDDGDRTEIGEKGINLSGGQKARISLARALYQGQDVYLLDDPLSAVDSHVGEQLFNGVIGPNGLLRNKTRILVTNELSYLKFVDQILVMANGEIVSQGTYYELMETGELPRLMEEWKMEQKNREEEETDVYISDDEDIFREEDSDDFDRRSMLSTLSGLVTRRHRRFSSNRYTQLNRRRLSTTKSAVSNIEQKPAAKPLTGVEKMETGSVKISVYLKYFKAMGLGCSMIFLFGMVFGVLFSIARNLWLTDWSNDDKEHRNAPKTSIYDRLYVYAAIGTVEVILTFLGMVALLFGGESASRNLHSSLLRAIFRAPMHFFDTTPFGRILNRVGKDIETVDFLLPYNIQFFVQCVLQVVSTLMIIMFTTPRFCVIVVPLTIMYLFVMKSYVATSRQLKRLEAVTRSPIYSHLSESINGAMTIRAFKLVSKFSQVSKEKVAANVECRYLNNVTNRWLAVRLEFIGNCVVFFAALFAALYRDSINSGMLGLSVTYALNITFVLNFAVRQISKLESNIVSVERIMEYSATESEADWHVNIVGPPKEWPQAGHIIFHDYETRYRPGLNPVITDLNIEIFPREKIGIVGRTGAGKSSVTLALFRIIEPTHGSIIIDGINISGVGLHDLRANITIIPQDPVLFSGTLRFNVDPFLLHSDDEIWQALESANLKKVAESSRLLLDQAITEGGENISIGQRQLVCLARALLRRTTILVLDEATAAVDINTDALIQRTIREKFANATIITIAHRLNTIMDYDRIIVLDQGKVVEFDSPQALLANRTSQFYSMCRGSREVNERMTKS